MQTFRDTADRVWTVAINVAAVKRVRAMVDVDLYGLVGDGFKALGDLLGDPVKLVDVLFVLCQAEAQAKGISDEEFGAAMAGDALEHAAEAFLGALRDFFPNPRVRAGIEKMLTASRTLRDRLIDRMEMELGKVDLDSALERLIASSGSSPESSGSTPGPSPFASST